MLLKKLLTQSLSRTIYNQYKRHDIFKCLHHSHQSFEHRVSAYHVLKAKHCYPHGCIYFDWKCRKLNKGMSCARKFRHVGKKCFNCREFYEEKKWYVPELLISEKEYRHFLKEYAAFESWLDGLKGRNVSFSGTINSIKPSYYHTPGGKLSQLSFGGFLLNFKEGYINLDHFMDFVYAQISPAMQQRLRLCKGDKINFLAHLFETDGRIVLMKVRQVQIDEKEEGEIWTEGRAMLARKTGSIIPVQNEKCLHCERGVLLDINAESGRRRMLFCLEGITDPAQCSYTVAKLLLS